jgi:hypothetical protein
MSKIYFIKFLILSLFINVACEHGPRSGKDDEVLAQGPMGPKDLPLDATVKIYFENTLSMDGYINGNTDFKDVFRELLVDVDNEKEIDYEIEFYLVNNELNQEHFDVPSIKISEKLTPQSTNNKGNKGSSNFEDILNTVLENQEGDVISVLMADFIYSPGGETDTPSALNKLRTYTQDAFLRAGKQNSKMDTRIYSFTSKFDGTYFDINNKHIKGVEKRPYYYFVMAPSNLMQIFEKNILSQLKINPGFVNEAFFSSMNFSTLKTQVLASTANNGRLNTRDGIEVIGYPKQGNLEFVVVLDLSLLPLNDHYLLNKDNYQLLNPEFSIKDMGVVQGKTIKFDGLGSTKIDPSSQVSMKGKNFTHAILFSTDGLVSEDLKFALKKKVPSWVLQADSEDDQNIKSDSLEQTKTFGFAPLVEGVAKAYEQQAGNNDYFNVKITVNNN